MKKYAILFLMLCPMPLVFGQTLSPYQTQKAIQTVKQILKAYESAFCVYINPSITDKMEKQEALNRLWTTMRSDARFYNDLVPDNKGSLIIDFSEYVQIPRVSYGADRGLSYSLDWEEAEIKRVPTGYIMFFYGYKTLVGDYKNERPLRIEGKPCRAGVFLTYQGSEIVDGKIGFMDTDFSQKGKTTPLTDLVNPLNLLTLPEAVDKLASSVSNQLSAAGLVKKVSIETFSYDDKKVLNDFSHQVTSTLKTSLKQHHPNVDVVVITRSAAFEPYMTLRGHYTKDGNYLKLNTQLYNGSEQAVGPAMKSEILLINLPNVTIEPPISMVEEVKELNRVLENPSQKAVNAGGLKLEIATNKGTGPQSYSEHDTMQISVRANKPCLVRLVYRDAGNNLVLLRNQDFKISEYDVNRWVDVPEDFECSSPFGVELLMGFATTGIFNPLKTKKEGGFTFILDDLKRVKDSSSEPRAMRNIGVSVAEKSIQVTTRANKK